MTEAVGYRLRSAQIEEMDIKSSEGERDDVRVGNGKEGCGAWDILLAADRDLRMFSFAEVTIT
jgi:hypothetical protein